MIPTQAQAMIPAQPILALILAVIVAVYLMKLRTQALDVLLLIMCFAGAILLIFYPAVADQLAHVVGVGRGADLITYLAIPGLALFLLLTFSRTRELNTKLTTVVRELALANARPHTPSERE